LLPADTLIVALIAAITTTVLLIAASAVVDSRFVVIITLSATEGLASCPMPHVWVLMARWHDAAMAQAACVQQMFRAINYMHQNGIMHRDVKPENWLLASKEARPWHGQSADCDKGTREGVRGPVLTLSGPDLNQVTGCFQNRFAQHASSGGPLGRRLAFSFEGQSGS